MRVDISDFVVNNTKSVDDEYYTLIGKESFLDQDGFPRTSENSSVIYAKAIKNKKTKNLQNSNIHYRYFVLADKNNILYNPIVLHSVDDSNSHTYDFINEVCKNGLDFKEVPYNIFKNYLSFLKTSSKKFLTQAQRDMV